MATPVPIEPMLTNDLLSQAINDTIFMDEEFPTNPDWASFDNLAQDSNSSMMDWVAETNRVLMGENPNFNQSMENGNDIQMIYDYNFNQGLGQNNHANMDHYNASNIYNSGQDINYADSTLNSNFNQFGQDYHISNPIQNDETNFNATPY